MQQFGINPPNVGYFVLDNVSNNDVTVCKLAEEMGFSASYRRLRCGSYTLNLIGQTLLWGKDADAFNNNTSKYQDAGPHPLHHATKRYV
jgi:hypothetical protein